MKSIKIRCDIYGLIELAEIVLDDNQWNQPVFDILESRKTQIEIYREYLERKEAGERVYDVLDDLAAKYFRSRKTVEQYIYERRPTITPSID